MLCNIDATVSTVEEKRFNVRKQLVKLGKKYRKLDRIVKSGIVDMEKNFIYYLNNGADIDELKFYFEHHDKETVKMMEMWGNQDSIFAKKLKGRSIVLAEISKVLNSEID